MGILQEILLIAFVLVAIALIALILIQQGKGSDMGASFGAGASATLFGSSGSGNAMTKITAILATIFFVLCLVLGSMTANSTKQTNEWENLATDSAPATVPAEEKKPVENLPPEN
ncbi:preprotein translocase subunit SecG [Algicola sagamiensis]|uniref:preprotein translocase subunit SecG n=1 Tax=Algicola sagamiensis TaxID=163869 RepID=UPI00035DE683|nr:preprotein translocase subunit SecG [Algicola sagamiensis]